MGSALVPSLDEAREKTQIVRLALANNDDPKRALRVRKIVTFGEMAEDVITFSCINWKNKAKEERVWRNALFDQCSSIVDVDIKKIKTDEIVNIVTPIVKKPLKWANVYISVWRKFLILR